MRLNPVNALRFAGAGLVALALIAYGALEVGALRRLDAAILTGFVGLRGPRVDPVAHAVAGLADPRPFVIVGAVLVCVAIARGQVRVALAVPAILALANGTTQVLKPVLSHARDRVPTVWPEGLVSAWPSGHATAAMALALCATLVVGPRARPFVAALGGCYAVAVAYGLLTLGWHYPADVLGGFLVATVWTLLGVAALGAADARWPAGTGRAAAARAGTTLAPSLLVGLLAAGAAAIVALARLESTLSYAEAHTAFVAGAAAIGMLGLALASGLALALRR